MLRGVSTFSREEIAERWAANIREYERIIKLKDKEIFELTDELALIRRKLSHGCIDMSCSECRGAK